MRFRKLERQWRRIDNKRRRVEEKTQQVALLARLSALMGGFQAGPPSALPPLPPLQTLSPTLPGKIPPYLCSTKQFCTKIFAWMCFVLFCEVLGRMEG